ncbi:hypothetical protein DXC03_19485 [Phocaeicola vulgatus]|nr:hypothetical protein DXC03_19485 [Phocaeicola vulgatus]
MIEINSLFYLSGITFYKSLYQNKLLQDMTYVHFPVWMVYHLLKFLVIFLMCMVFGGLLFIVVVLLIGIIIMFAICFVGHKTYTCSPNTNLSIIH